MCKAFTVWTILDMWTVLYEFAKLPDFKVFVHHLVSCNRGAGVSAAMSSDLCFCGKFLRCGVHVVRCIHFFPWCLAAKLLVIHATTFVFSYFSGAVSTCGPPQWSISGMWVVNPHTCEHTLPRRCVTVSPGSNWQTSARVQKSLLSGGIHWQHHARENF